MVVYYRVYLLHFQNMYVPTYISLDFQEFAKFEYIPSFKNAVHTIFKRVIMEFLAWGYKISNKQQWKISWVFWIDMKVIKFEISTLILPWNINSFWILDR